MDRIKARQAEAVYGTDSASLVCPIGYQLLDPLG